MKSYYTTLIKLGTAAALLIFITTHSFAQSDLSSPYSLFGPGIPSPNLSVSQYGMGGSGVALIDQYKMNFANPAALAYYLEPIFETSGAGTFSTFKTNTGSFENQNFILNNLSLSFPIKRGVWGLTVGLKPYTTVGYDVNTTTPNPDLSSDAVTEYSGDGGINQGYLGMAYKVYSKTDSAGNTSTLAIGSNFNFNFGTIDNNRQIYFPTNRETLGLRIQESVLIRDVNFDFGVHYQTNLIGKSAVSSNYLKFLAGATISTSADLKAQKNATAFNFLGSYLLPGDTLSSVVRQDGRVNLPMRVTAGIGLDYITEKRRRFRFALDYTTQEWSAYSEKFGDDVTTFNFQNSHIISTGLEYTPQLGASKYLRSVEYRAGFKYEKTNLNINGTDVNDIGMSFGLSLPLHHRRGLTKSAFHISGQYGTYGTTDSELIQEDYFKIFVGFSFTPHFRNRWFVQPKYD
ncbi:hypothetical protein G3O08_05920 [Cryomorpha ignava]|uniref:Aromatic hydrocarbon degradation protein n=1 Tax=Cryomorpha ignava TaxID=101383 RepID=A0A7K3WQK5_9FLAO|nr:hypothetical protein [Cryomorpha ignava]NEN23035.1 hypothetical protein [Cryomorpha ignava]